MYNLLSLKICSIKNIEYDHILFLYVIPISHLKISDQLIPAIKLKIVQLVLQLMKHAISINVLRQLD